MRVLRLWSGRELDLCVGAIELDIEPCQERVHVCVRNRRFGVRGDWTLADLYATPVAEIRTIISSRFQSKRRDERKLLLLDCPEVYVLFDTL